MPSVIISKLQDDTAGNIHSDTLMASSERGEEGNSGGSNSNSSTWVGSREYSRERSCRINYSHPFYNCEHHINAITLV